MKIKNELEKCKSLSYFAKNYLKINGEKLTKYQLETIKWLEDKIKEGYRMELIKVRDKSVIVFVK